MAVVGSGPGVLSNERGMIDGHDVVVRVNNYRVGREAGRRTDVHYSFYGSSIRKQRDELVNDGVKLCMCKCPNSRPIKSDWHVANRQEQGIDFRYIYLARRGWWFCDTYVPTDDEFMEDFNLLGRHIPTTGFSAIRTVLSYAPKRVYLTGFDFFSSGLHNVDEPWHRKNVGDPIGHVPEKELAWVAAHAHKEPLLFDNTLAHMIDGVLSGGAPARSA